MSFAKNLAEIERLIKAFDAEASKFPDLELYTYFLANREPTFDRSEVRDPHHGIVLWQYYGGIHGEAQIDELLKKVQKSGNLRFGVSGSRHTLFAILQGEACPLFVRMARRAGSLFDHNEATQLRSALISEVLEREKSLLESEQKAVVVVNDNAVAIWINYLLYHLSMSHPGRERAHRISPDPFALSLLALERLASDNAIGKIDRSTKKLSDIRFRVAMSFPGEKRAYVSQVVGALREPLGRDAVFYDHDYQAQLALPNLDTLLQDIYRNRSDLIVVFLCAEYAEKEWCGLEWRAIRDIIKGKRDDQVMFVRFDSAQVDGVFSIDGFIDATVLSPFEVAQHILKRIHESQ